GTPGKDNQTGAGALHLPTGVTVTDKTPPKAKALPSSGLKGHFVKLLSRIFDNSGQVRVREQVKQNGRVVKTFTTPFVSTPKVESGYINWKAPAKPTGSFQHCVRAQDKTGNVSPVSCATLTLH